MIKRRQLLLSQDRRADHPQRGPGHWNHEADGWSAMTVNWKQIVVSLLHVHFGHARSHVVLARHGLSLPSIHWLWIKRESDRTSGITRHMEPFCEEFRAKRVLEVWAVLPRCWSFKSSSEKVHSCIQSTIPKQNFSSLSIPARKISTQNDILEANYSHAMKIFSLIFGYWRKAGRDS